MTRNTLLVSLIGLLALLSACGGGQGSPTAEAGEPLANADAVVDFWSERTSRDGGDFVALARLGAAEFSRARLTNDVSGYARAAESLEAALALAPGDAGTQVQLGFVYTALHRFGDALALADAALEQEPRNAAAHALRGDALFALGRYDEVEEPYRNARKFAPGLETTARLAQFHALRDESRAATLWDEALRSLDAAQPADAAWALTQSGRYALSRGDVDTALSRFEDALDYVDGYAPARSGQADAFAAAGRLKDAIAIYEEVTDVQPAVEHLLALADLYRATGETALAGEQVQVLLGIDAIYREAGVDTDLAMARFHADYGDPERAVDLARAAREAAPTAEANDALAWALFRSGDSGAALPFALDAVDLSPLTAQFHYHLAAIAAELGDFRLATRHAAIALAINAGFSPLDAPRAGILVAIGLVAEVMA